MATMRSHAKLNRAAVLAAMPGTRPEIEAKTGLGAATVWRWVKDLHGPDEGRGRECHIGRWRHCETGGRPMPVYVAGPGRDAPCRLTPATDAERASRYRERLRRSGEWEDKKARMRARYWAKRPPKRDPLTAALFGST